ncbi:hypothetical protein FRC07_006362 [Ceratobasidium sp. 392]|nr:hypothetical protein FRC07_006362 [Ceratobasidium sp. 392]
MQPFLQHPSAKLPSVNSRQDAQANQNDNGNKLSVADSLVLLQSLKQSRSIWLTKAFLKFSTRSKNKADQVISTPPPHSLALVGSCDFEIGPHLFPQTNIYFVQYQYTHPPVPVPAPKPVPAPAPVHAPTPSATQPVAPITVSHELHAKVLAAAAKDPELHTILQLAAQGRANVAQLRVLGTTIKALEAGTYPSVSGTGTQTQVGVSASSAPDTVPTASTSRQPAVVPSPTPVPVAQSTASPASNAIPRSTPAPIPTPVIPTTAILLEFAERPIDRWLLPTEYVLLDKTPNGDVLLSTFYPFDAYIPSGGLGPNGATVRSKPAHPLTMRFVAAPAGVWNALSRTCTIISPGSAQGVLAEVITNVPPRTYLQYRIAPGSLWEDLKTKNPSAKSVLLPSTIPKPSASTRRAEDSTTGGATKKRKTTAGDSTGTTTPAEGATTKSKGKGKEKEKGSTPTGTKRPASIQSAATSNVATVATTNQQGLPANPNPAAPSAQAPTTSTTVAASSVDPIVPTSGATHSIAGAPPNTAGSTTTSTTHSARVANAPHTLSGIPHGINVTPTIALPIPTPNAASRTSSIPSSQTQGGTLNQALPPQPTPSAPRAPVQHVSVGQPGEGVKVLGAGPTSGP